MPDVEPFEPTGDFDRFYLDHHASIARTLALTLGDDQLGREAADEAMARAWERWDQVQTYANPEGWVYRVGHNWATSWLRRRKRSQERDPLVATRHDHDDRLPDTDLADAVRRLSDDHRTVIVLRYHRDWTIDQIAVALDVRPGTVKSRLNRAVAHLDQILGESPLVEPTKDVRS